MPKHAVLSDIHANLAAFEAVLADLDQSCPEADIWCLGDTVMYGPQPIECVQLLKERAKLVVSGNNDVSVTAEESPKVYVTEDAFDDLGAASGTWIDDKRVANRATLEWTRTELKKEPALLAWLVQVCYAEGSLKSDGNGSRERIVRNEGLRESTCLLVHASPCEPLGLNGNYLRDEEDAEEALVSLHQGEADHICFFGHTHRPTVFVETNLDRNYGNCESRPALPGADNRLYLNELKTFNGHRLNSPRRILINPGSVGQPRTPGDRRAGYLIYDDSQNVIEFRRVTYDWRQTVNILRSHPQLSTIDCVPSVYRPKYEGNQKIVSETLARRLEESF